MRRIYIVIAALLMFSLTSMAQSDSTLVDNEATKESVATETTEELNAWDKANVAYNEGQYQVAELLYQQLVEEGYQDPAIYYNLGNTYFNQNQIGKAILNYKRAYLANPSDADIKYNLELAESKTKDKIDKLPSFFLFSWASDLRDLMDTNTWAELSIILLVIGLGMVLLWLLANSLTLRKVGFYTSTVISILFIISVICSFSSANYVYNSSEAIVTSSAALIKSAPSENSKDLFVVHEGTSVTVIQELNEWNEVALIDGNKGWIITGAIEKVIPDND